MTQFRAIAVAQTCPQAGDVDANLSQHLRLAEIAAARGAQVVLFPELSLTGYEIGLAAELAFQEHDARLAPLAEAASAHAIAIIAGAPLRVADRLHIAAFVLYAGGASTIYTKHRLGAFAESARCDGIVPPAEATVFHPGDRNPLVRVGHRSAALAICADIAAASHVQQAADRGAAAYLASMFVIPSEFEADAAKLRRHAAQHGMAAALANFGSPSGGLAAAGRSSIWSPAGDLLAQLGPGGAGVAIAAETGQGWRVETVRV